MYNSGFAPMEYVNSYYTPLGQNPKCSPDKVDCGKHILSKDVPLIL